MKTREQRYQQVWHIELSCRKDSLKQSKDDSGLKLQGRESIGDASKYPAIQEDYELDETNYENEKNFVSMESYEGDGESSEYNDGYDTAETRSVCASTAEIFDNQQKTVEVRKFVFQQVNHPSLPFRLNHSTKKFSLSFSTKSAAMQQRSSPQHFSLLRKMLSSFSQRLMKLTSKLQGRRNFPTSS